MSILSLGYIEAHTLNGKRLFRGKEEVGFVRNEDFEQFKKNRDQEPPIQLHPSQFNIRNAPEEDLDPAEVAKNVTDAMNDFADAINNMKEVDNDDQ